MAMASPDAHPTRESSAISDIDHFQFRHISDFRQYLSLIYKRATLATVG